MLIFINASLSLYKSIIDSYKFYTSGDDRDNLTTNVKIISAHEKWYERKTASNLSKTVR